jgi:hypothetical protein
VLAPLVRLLSRKRGLGAPLAPRQGHSAAYFEPGGCLPSSAQLACVTDRKAVTMRSPRVASNNVAAPVVWG